MKVCDGATTASMLKDDSNNNATTATVTAKTSKAAPKRKLQSANATRMEVGWRVFGGNRY